MRKISVFLALIALTALTALPGHATDLEPAPQAQVDLPLEEAFMSPAVEPQLSVPADPSQDGDEMIRACDPWEAEEYCDPGCDCVVTTKVICYC